MRISKRSYYLIQFKLVSNESAIEAQIALEINSFGDVIQCLPTFTLRNMLRTQEDVKITITYFRQTMMHLTSSRRVPNFVSNVEFFMCRA